MVRHRAALGGGLHFKRNFTTMNRAAIATSAILIAAGAGLAQAEPVKLELQLVDHLGAEMIEQDVYVERTAGSTEVYRVTTEDAANFDPDGIERWNQEQRNKDRKGHRITK